MGPALRLIPGLILGLILNLVLPSQLVVYIYIYLSICIKCTESIGYLIQASVVGVYNSKGLLLYISLTVIFCLLGLFESEDLLS